MLMCNSIWIILFLQLGILPICDQLIANQQNNVPRVRWYKGNLHTHSLWSDGNDFPEMITKWYAERDYHFLAMTDHNILSRGEKWMYLKEIEHRGGHAALQKYRQAFGSDWVETRDENKTAQVRLKSLQEYRKKFEKSGQFLLMTGEEISDSVSGLPVHLNATNLKKLLRPAGGKTVREVMNNNLRSALEQSQKEQRKILVHLNHPNFGWAVTAEDLAFVTLEKYFEVYNAHPEVNHLGNKEHPSVEKLWDIANTIRIDRMNSAPLMGLATDDSHNYHGNHGSRPGRGWVMVRANDLSADAILHSIDQGDFYASSGVTLEDISYDCKLGRLRIQIAPRPGETYTTRFIGTPKTYNRESRPRLSTDGIEVRATRIYSPEVGQTFATVQGAEATYKFTGDELYIRAVVTSCADHVDPSFKNQKQQAWTQPVGWKEHVKASK